LVSSKAVCPYLGTVLTVELSPSRRCSFQATLSNLGFGTIPAAGFDEVLNIARQSEVHAVLLADISLERAIQLCRSLRRSCRLLPILMITDEDSEVSRVEALDAGADDCLAKQVGPFELRARLCAAIRRIRLFHGEERRSICVGGISLDSSRHSLHKRGMPVHLTPKEFAVLRVLMEQTGKLVPYGRILRLVWGPEYGNEIEYLRVVMRSLRRKLEDEPARPKHLLTVSCLGYRFES
jgi:two-component system KDP operon response regulator KdpE